MLKEFADNWWSFSLRGVFALLFGMGALSYPGLTLLVLIIFFGAWALVDGVTALVMGFGGDKKWYLLAGVVSILAGLIAVARPGATALAVLLVIGIWAVAKGITEMAAALQLRKDIEGEWAMALSGLVSLLFGLFVIVRPGAGALAIAWMIATYAFIFGILQLLIGFRLRRLKKEMEAGAAPAM
jgi:uncharacterized membrane protein HdeD (DUF308 family)